MESYYIPLAIVFSLITASVLWMVWFYWPSKEKPSQQSVLQTEFDTGLSKVSQRQAEELASFQLRPETKTKLRKSRPRSVNGRLRHQRDYYESDNAQGMADAAIVAAAISDQNRSSDACQSDHGSGGNSSYSGSGFDSGSSGGGFDGGGGGSDGGGGGGGCD